MGPGDAIDHYRLERHLGAGAFATVWLARDEYLDAHVAIKVLADNWARNDEIRRRFIEEAKIMRFLDHDRMVRVFTVGSLPSGQPMFVMSYADRGTLADRIEAQRERAQRFSYAEVASIAIEMVSVLGVVHDLGVIHRDMKPSNVLYRSVRPMSRADGGPSPQTPVDEVLVLADFGLAKDLTQSSGFTLAAGTPAYMAPEQARINADLDHRADLYAATAVLFELLTGSTPFDGRSIGDVGRASSSPSDRLRARRPDIPTRWQELVDIGLADSPADRYQSAGELADAIRDAADVGQVGRVDAHRAAATVLRTDPWQRDNAPTVIHTGIRRQVAMILQSFDAERSAAVDRRLDDICSVGIVASDAEFANVLPVVVGVGLRPVRLRADDVRIGDTDVVVVGAEHDPTDHVEQLADILSEAPAGPIAIIASSDLELVGSTISTLAARSDVVRASAALATLDALVARAGSAALSESWVRVGDHVENLRFETPAFAELHALREDAAGRIRIPVPLRIEMRRLLFGAEATTRLDLPDDATEAEMLDVAVSTLARWRAFQDSGRVPFASRQTVETTVRSLERLWAALTGYTL